MRKVLVTLMMVFGLLTFVSCATTSPVDTSVVIDKGDWLIITSSDNTPTYFDEYSDSKKVEIYKALAPEVVNGKRLVYDGFEFHKADKYVEMYHTYFFVKKDETYAVLVSNIGDGRELRLYYYLKDIVE